MESVPIDALLSYIETYSVRREKLTRVAQWSFGTPAKNALPF